MGKLPHYAIYFLSALGKFFSRIVSSIPDDEETPKENIRVVKKRPDMQFTYGQYSSMFANVWRRSPHEEEFWDIVTKIAWLIVLIENNEEVSAALRGIDDEERSRMIRSWIGTR